MTECSNDTTLPVVNRARVRAFLVPAGDPWLYQQGLFFHYSTKYTSAVHLLCGTKEKNEAPTGTTYCGAQGCTFSASLAHGTNIMKNHLVSTHSSAWAAAQLFASAGAPVSASAAMMKGFMDSMRVTKYSDEDIRAINEVGALAVGSSCIPTTIWENPLFRLFLFMVSKGGYKLPSRRTMDKIIYDKWGNEVPRYLAALLQKKEIRACALVVDVWTPQNKDGMATLASAFFNMREFELQSHRLGAPSTGASHTAEAVDQAVSQFLSQVFPQLLKVVHCSVSDTPLRKFGRINDLKVFICNLHELDLVIGDSCAATPAISASFSAVEALNHFIHQSNLAGRLWFECSGKMTPPSGGGRMYSQADLLDNVFSEENERQNSIQNFKFKVNQNNKRFAVEPSFMREKIGKPDKPGQHTANPRYLSDVKVMFLRLIQPLLSFMVKVQRKLSIEKKLTAHLAAPLIAVLVMKLHRAKSELTPADIPARNQTPRQKLEEEAKGMARDFLRTALQSIRERYQSKNCVFSENGYFPALLHPFVFGKPDVVKFIIPAGERSGELYADVMKRFLGLLMDTITELDERRSSAVIEEPNDAKKRKLSEDLDPEPVAKAASDMISDDDDFIFSGPLSDVGAPIQKTLLERAKDVMSAYERASQEFIDSQFPGGHFSLSTLLDNLEDDKVFAKFWKLFAERVAKEPDVDALLLMVERYCPVPAANAAVERMGTTGRYLSYGNKTAITEEHLETKILLGSMKDDILLPLVQELYSVFFTAMTQQKD